MTDKATIEKMIAEARINSTTRHNASSADDIKLPRLVVLSMFLVCAIAAIVMTLLLTFSVSLFGFAVASYIVWAKELPTVATVIALVFPFILLFMAGIGWSSFKEAVAKTKIQYKNRLREHDKSK